MPEARATSRARIAGTRPATPAGARRVRAVDPSETVDVTVLLRDRGMSGSSSVFDLGSLRVRDRQHLTPDELLRRSRADDSDIRAVRRFAAAHRLQVLRVHAGRRVVVLRGRVRQLAKAFGASLFYYRHRGSVVR